MLAKPRVAWALQTVTHACRGKAGLLCCGLNSRPISWHALDLAQAVQGRCG